MERPCRLTRLLRLLCFCLVIISVSSSLPADDAGDDFFENEVRPLLISKCGECHSGDDPSGGLRVDTRADFFRGGDSGVAIDSKQLSKSLMLAAIRRTGDIQMPPEDPLTEGQLAVFEKWFQLGAPWPETTALLGTAQQRADSHWAFQPVTDPPIPNVAVSQLGTPVDAFILARLNEAGFSQAPPADKRTLIRRVYYTLTGLPPTNEQVEQFASSQDEHAFETLVDELLNSPRYGEHWARHWLDVARYADSKGYVYAREERFWVHSWTYRDWVINAFNEDMPYDRFLKLQIAADQVEDRRDGDLAAMGFLTLGRRFLGVPWEIINDRIDTLCRGTMGLTVACARCHDHKYDPIPTADYYSLYGVFDNCEEQFVRLPTETTDSAAEEELKKLQSALDEALQTHIKESSDRARSRVRDYLQAQTELEKYPAQGFDQVFSKEDLLPEFVRRWQSYLHQAERDRDPVFVAWWLYRALSEESFATAADKVSQHLATLSPREFNPLVQAEFTTPPQSFTDVIDRYGTLLKRIDEQWQAVLGENRDAKQLDDPAAEALRQVLYGPTAPCQVPEDGIVHTEQYFDTDTINALWKLQGDVDRHIIASGRSLPYSVILADRDHQHEPRILRRGNPIDFGDDVPRQFLGILSKGERVPFEQGSGRLELAESIIDPDNPLTARVMVNRVWTQHFGEGLVTTPSDFGLRASPPSHPELLDWLTSRFIESGWSLKSLHRWILLSKTYQQSSQVFADDPQLSAKQKSDPENRLLWRMNRHRLTFEEYRDSMLAVSGELDLASGGKPDNLFAAPYPQRRTVFGQIDRQYLPGVLRVFDFANPDLHIPKRSETTVPQQSLFSMNHPLVIERVRALAKQANRELTSEDQVRSLFTAALQREPAQSEVDEAIHFLSLADEVPKRDQAPTESDWQYGYGTYAEESKLTKNFSALPHFTGSAWQGGPNWPDAALGWVQLTATGGHPGNDRAHAAIRRWTAPQAMTIRITSTLLNAPAAGDGIRGFIVSSQAGLLSAAESHQQSVELNVDALEVEAGVTIDFIVDIKDVLNSDQFTWQIQLSSNDQEPVWNAADDFPAERIPQLNGLEQLAQLILCTNEFMFID